MTPAVETHDAFRIFESAAGGTVALQGLTLSVEPGEIVVVLGPSGSGKSTLLRVLAGFEQLTAGTARVHGVEIGRLDRGAAAAFRARHMGLLDQHYARFLSPDLTCLQSVALQLRILGWSRAEAEDRARSTLERVGLADRAGDHPGLLSGGEQQRVAVCAAVAHRPRLLLADEPAGELDADNAAIVYEMIGEFVRESEGSAVIVSHDTAAADIADRLVYIRDGRVVEEARPDEPRSLIASHGWVRIPEPLLRQAGHPREFAVADEGGEIVLRPLGHGPDEPAAEADEPADREGDEVVVAALEHVIRRFGAGPEDEAVLDDVSCSFAAGTFTAVVGRSGSGKTTLLHLLAGLDRPTSGSVTLHGHKLDGLDRTELAALRRLHVALVTQEPGLIPYLTATENTRLALALRERPDDHQALVEQVLADVSLEHRADTPAARLSAGERQRLAIARALAAGTDLLLMDEPTARLDEENAHAVARLLGRAARVHGLAVVCATHDPVLIEAADTILPLQRRIDRVDLLPAV
jgi:ABC-type lipoprotein export system ATPase subunit